mgnify:CR=1 FL=1
MGDSVPWGIEKCLIGQTNVSATSHHWDMVEESLGVFFVLTKLLNLQMDRFIVIL